MHGLPAVEGPRESAYIELSLRARAANLCHFRTRGKVSRNRLANANATRDWRIYASLAKSFYSRLRMVSIAEVAYDVEIVEQYGGLRGVMAGPGDKRLPHVHDRQADLLLASERLGQRYPSCKVSTYIKKPVARRGCPTWAPTWQAKSWTHTKNTRS